MGVVSVLKLATIGFMSGLLNAGFGLGSTFIVNPNLIKLDKNINFTRRNFFFSNKINVNLYYLMVIFFF